MENSKSQVFSQMIYANRHRKIVQDLFPQEIVVKILRYNNNTSSYDERNTGDLQQADNKIAAIDGIPNKPKFNAGHTCGAL